MRVQTMTFPDYIPEYVWQKLSDSMQTESTILNTRTSPNNLAKLYNDGNAIVKMINTEPVGFISAWPVHSGFFEIGSAWIHPSLRGQGLGKDLYIQIKDLSVIKKSTSFAVTQSPIALKSGFHAGLKIHQDWSDPVPWFLTCGPCDILDDIDKADCKMRNTTCWLRVIKDS